MNFKVNDNKYASRLVLHNNGEVQFKDHVAIVPAQIAYIMARGLSYQDFIFEDKRVPFNPDSWREEKRIVWGANFASASGFGMVAENTVRELIKLGVNCLTYGMLSGNVTTGSEYVDPIVNQSIGKVIEPDCIEIQHVQPPSFKNNIVERQWIYTMFETTHIPRGWVNMLNLAERIIVPSKWLVDNWHEQGVTKPINVVGHGIDPKVFYYLDRPKRDIYTFVHYCRLSLRKGTDLVVKAFAMEFGNRKDVQLVVKNTIPFFPFTLNLPNIKKISATYSKEKLRQFLFEADCMVFPTRGEGFGLPALEAMAVGLPTILTNWGGTADFFDPSDTLPVEYTMGRSYEFDAIYKVFLDKASNENTGEWAELSLESLRKQMRWCYEHREEAKEMGKHAAERIAREWTWPIKIQSLYDIIDANV